MGFKARIIGADSLQKKLTQVEKDLLTRKIMGAVALDAVTFIKSRTLEGKDENNRDFKDYSKKPGYFKIRGKYRYFEEGYYDFKQSRGGSHFSGKVNLFNESDMFGALQPIRVTDATAILGFTKTEEGLKASGHQNGNPDIGLPERKFFGLGREGTARVMKLLDNHLSKVIGR